MILILLLLCFNVYADNQVYVDQIGDSNSYNLTQVGNSKTINITGRVNSESVSVTQTGDAQSTANIVFQQIQNSLPSNVSMTQSGNAIAPKSFDLTVNSPNVGVVVIQDNPNTSNAGSMNITCTVGPCIGYSYISH
jgi:hypothetical protein